jgi:SAM-dependent methyltransferase
MGMRRRAAGLLRLTGQLVTDSGVRRSWALRIRRPANLFQPHNDTQPNRYPYVFACLREHVRDGPEVRLLSFGCSTGDEVFSLRDSFPAAHISGFDISRGNISQAQRRQRRSGDTRMAFFCRNSVVNELADSYDAILCMATLRHGDLGVEPRASCEPLLTFTAFEETVAGFARCLRPGGLLAIEFSNFRFADAVCSRDFRCVLRRAGAPGDRTPLFGRDNQRLDDQHYDEIVFQKL